MRLFGLSIQESFVTSISDDLKDETKSPYFGRTTALELFTLIAVDRPTRRLYIQQVTSVTGRLSLPVRSRKSRGTYQLDRYLCARTSGKSNRKTSDTNLKLSRKPSRILFTEDIGHAQWYFTLRLASILQEFYYSRKRPHSSTLFVSMNNLM